VPASGNLQLVGRQLWLGRSLAGQQVRIWADLHSIHLSTSDGRLSRPWRRATAPMSWPCCTAARPPARPDRGRPRPPRCRAQPWSRSTRWSRRCRPRSRPSCDTGCQAPGWPACRPSRPLGQSSVERIVSQRGQIQLGSPRFQVGLRHARKRVMVLVHENRFEVLDHGELLKSVARTAPKEVTRFKAHEHQPRRG
jgi:hypothetical protein